MKKQNVCFQKGQFASTARKKTNYKRMPEDFWPFRQCWEDNSLRIAAKRWLLRHAGKEIRFLSGGLSAWKMNNHHNIANTTHLGYYLNINIHIKACRNPPPLFYWCLIVMVFYVWEVHPGQTIWTVLSVSTPWKCQKKLTSIAQAFVFLCQHNKLFLFLLLYLFK